MANYATLEDVDNKVRWTFDYKAADHGGALLTIQDGTTILFNYDLNVGCINYYTLYAEMKIGVNNGPCALLTSLTLADFPA